MEYFQSFYECWYPILSIGIFAMSCGCLRIPGTGTQVTLYTKSRGCLFVLCLCSPELRGAQDQDLPSLCLSFPFYPTWPKLGPGRADGRGTDEPHRLPRAPQCIPGTPQNLPVYLMTFCLPTRLVLPHILFLVARACRALADGQCQMAQCWWQQDSSVVPFGSRAHALPTCPLVAGELP